MPVNGSSCHVPSSRCVASSHLTPARTSGLRCEPPPFVLKKSLGDFCITYELNVFCDTPSRIEAVYTELHGHILDVFNEYGIQIMVPAYEGDTDQPKIVPKEHWYAAPASSPQSQSERREMIVPGGFGENNSELTRAYFKENKREIL